MDFLKEIDDNQKILSNKKLFIAHRNLKLYKLPKKCSSKRIPYNVYMGSSYLIKGNNIICLYSYCDYGQSQHVQINKKKDRWTCNISIMHMENGDPENLMFLVGDSDRIVAPSVLEYFMHSFIQAGFELYLHS